MATSFEEIRLHVRGVLGDTDPVVTRYPNEVIDTKIRFVILTMNNSDIQEDGTSGQFTTNLTPVDKSKVIIKTALGLLAPSQGEFSYRNPVVSVTRKGGTAQLYRYLENLLSEVSGGGKIVISSETDLEAMLKGVDRFMNEFTDAI